MIALSLISAIQFGAVLLVVLPIAVVCSILMMIYVRKRTISEFHAYDEASNIAQETLSSIRTVLALGLHKLFIGKYAEKLHIAERLAIHKSLMVGIFSGITNMILSSAHAVAVVYGVYLVHTDCENYTPGHVIQSFYSMFVGALSFSYALPLIKEFSEAKVAANKIFAILKKPSTIDVFKSKGKQLADFKGKIEFKEVEFRYPTRTEKQVLNKMSFKISAGCTTALVGSR